MHYYISFVGGPYCEECVPKNENPCTCPPDFPVCVCGKNQREYYNKKPILPSEEELEYNSRSKSAKLRILNIAKIGG